MVNENTEAQVKAQIMDERKMSKGQLIHRIRVLETLSYELIDLVERGVSVEDDTAKEIIEEGMMILEGEG